MFGARAHRPVQFAAPADRGLPFRTELAEKVAPHKSRAAAIGAMNHHDLALRQAHAPVRGTDPGVVPVLDLTQVNFSQHLGSEIQGTRDAREIVNRNDGAEYGSEMLDLGSGFGHARFRQRHVRGRKIDFASEK